MPCRLLIELSRLKLQSSGDRSWLCRRSRCISRVWVVSVVRAWTRLLIARHAVEALSEAEVGKAFVGVGVVCSRSGIFVPGVVHPLVHAEARSAWPQVRIILPWPRFCTVASTLQLCPHGVNGGLECG